MEIISELHFSDLLQMTAAFLNASWKETLPVIFSAN
jgi:hypothetical protein